MFDSRTDAPDKGVHWRRANYKRERMFVNYNTFGRTFRSEHQAPAPDFDAPLVPWVWEIPPVCDLHEALDVYEDEEFCCYECRDRSSGRFYMWEDMEDAWAAYEREQEAARVAAKRAAWRERKAFVSA